MTLLANTFSLRLHPITSRHLRELPIKAIDDLPSESNSRQERPVIKCSQTSDCSSDSES